MPRKTLPFTQTDIDHVVSDAVDLAEELGFPQTKNRESSKSGREAILLANISLFSLVVLYLDPVIEGWKRGSA